MKPFRIYHVLFGLAVAVAYFSAESTQVFHAWIGYTVATLLVIRLALGLARRSGFQFARLRPKLGTPPRGQGGWRHPAIGTMLTLALFLGVVTVAGTGVAMDRGGTLVGQSIRLEMNEEQEREQRVEQAAGAPGEHDEEEEGLLPEVHHEVGEKLLPLAILHILWMLLARWDMSRFMLFLPARRKAPRQDAAA